MKREAHKFTGSTRIRRGWYEKTTRTVELEFLDGVHVLYREVPAAVWMDLKDARSAGRFVTEVLDRYPYRVR